MEKMHLALIIGCLFLVGAVFVLGCTGTTDNKDIEDKEQMPNEPVVPPVVEEEEEVAGVYTELSVQEAKALIDSSDKLVVIDVSTAYDSGHLPDAINIVLEDLDAELPNLDSSKEYLVYCHTDLASKQGAQKLADAGFTTFRLYGNYGTWVTLGMPVER